jgi:hypothetical protein
VALDVKGTLDGKPFENPQQLAGALRDNPAATACIVNRLTAYGMGRPLTRDDAKFTKFAQEEFSGDDYNFTDLLRQLALSDALYAVREPVEKKPSKIVADSAEAAPAAVAKEESRS